MARSLLELLALSRALSHDTLWLSLSLSTPSRTLLNSRELSWTLLSETLSGTPPPPSLSHQDARLFLLISAIKFEPH